MNPEKLMGLIGLSRRAGQLSLGADTVLKRLKSGQCAAVLVDADAAPNTVKRMADAAKAARVPVLTTPAGLLERAVAQSGRMTAAIAQGGLAKQILLLYQTAQRAEEATDIERECGGA